MIIHIYICIYVPNIYEKLAQYEYLPACITILVIHKGKYIQCINFARIFSICMYTCMYTCLCRCIHRLFIRNNHSWVLVELVRIASE